MKTVTGEGFAWPKKNVCMRRSTRVIVSFHGVVGQAEAE